MNYLATIFGDVPQAFGLWMFLSIGAVALFGVLVPFVTWIEGRRKEREAFYKADTVRRLAEASGDGAKAAIEMLREEERLKAINKREGLKVAGLINLGVGVGLGILLYSIGGPKGDNPYLVGMIPGLIGVAMLVYVYVLAAPVDRR